MHADSIAINKTIPEYPSVEIVAMIKLERMPIIFATMWFLLDVKTQI
jgi:hypothetical protein